MQMDWGRLLWLSGNRTSKSWRRLWLVTSAAVAWSLWKARNNLVFNSSASSETVVFEQAQATAFEWIKVQGVGRVCSFGSWVEDPKRRRKRDKMGGGSCDDFGGSLLVSVSVSPWLGDAAGACYLSSIAVLGVMSMVSIGFNAAASVRVSNELDARNPNSDAFSVVTVTGAPLIIAFLEAVVVLVLRLVTSYAFTSGEMVSNAVSKLWLFEAVFLIPFGVQPVISGVAVGSGRQALVAFVSVGCFSLL
ncbi:hypothetical protein Ancab_039443 [Ancistrocladus abbreviatus]